MALLSIIPAILFAVQSAGFKQYSKKCDNSIGATSLFTTIYLAISAIISLIAVIIFDRSINVDSVVFGVIFGVLFYVFITMYSEAVKEGSLSITSFVYAMSMIIPIILSAIIFDEKISLLKIIGFVLMVVGIYLIIFANAHRKSEEKSGFSKKWLVLCIVGGIFNAMTIFTNKYFGLKVEGGSIYQYVCVGFIVATVLSTITFVLPKVRYSLMDFSINKWYLILAGIVALVNPLGNGFIAYLGGIIDTSVMLPIVNGLNITLATLISVFFFNEKMHTKTILGMIIGIASVVLLSI